jgi:hypothetical protein
MGLLNGKNLTIIALLLFIVNPVSAYELNVEYNGEFGSSKILKIDWIEGKYYVVNNKDLLIDIKAEIEVTKDILNHSDHFEIIFKPVEWINRPPAKDIEYTISSEGAIIKTGTLNEGGKRGEIHYRYTIPISVAESDFDSNFKSYHLELNYTKEDHIFKQGDYYVVALNFLDTDKNIAKDAFYHNLYLPSPNSIPYRFPEGVNSYRVVEYDKGNWINERWAFEFKGGGEKTFWYYDANDMKKKNLFLLVFGALMGVMLSKVFDYFFDNMTLTTRIILFVFVIVVSLIIGIYWIL